MWRGLSFSVKRRCLYSAKFRKKKELSQQFCLRLYCELQSVNSGGGGGGKEERGVVSKTCKQSSK